MSIEHEGVEDKKDDHKEVYERLLEVAIPPPPPDGSMLKLEDCLEDYFNNRIEIKRHLQRRNTLERMNSVRSMDKSRLQESESTDKGGTTHIEIVEVPSNIDSPLPQTPKTPTAPGIQKYKTPQTPPTPQRTPRPVDGRRRADSIFSERYVDDKKGADSSSVLSGRRRASSILRREVLMPAWQFFRLIRAYSL